MVFDLHSLVSLIIGIKKGKEREKERFQGRRCVSEAGLGGGS